MHNVARREIAPAFDPYAEELRLIGEHRGFAVVEHGTGFALYKLPVEPVAVFTRALEGIFYLRERRDEEEPLA